MDQPSLFLGLPRKELTPIDLFAESVRDATSGNDDAETLDGSLLAHIASAKNLLELGAESIEFASVASAPAVVLTPQDVERVMAMAARAPESRKIRAAGVLDTLSVSTGAFLLFHKDGVLRGIVPRISTEEARVLLGSRVLIEGELVYRPSGRPLRLDAAWIRIAKESDDSWSIIPRHSLGAPQRP